MAPAKTSKGWKAVAFTVIPAAYCSMPWWRPASEWTPGGSVGVPPLLLILMTATLGASLVSWNRFRLLSVMGFLVFLLWLLVTLLPVV